KMESVDGTRHVREDRHVDGVIADRDGIDARARIRNVEHQDLRKLSRLREFAQRKRKKRALCDGGPVRRLPIVAQGHEHLIAMNASQDCRTRKRKWKKRVVILEEKVLALKECQCTLHDGDSLLAIHMHADLRGDVAGFPLKDGRRGVDRLATLPELDD